MTERIAAITSFFSATIAFVSLKDFQIWVTIVAGMIAILSGVVSLLINLKKWK